MALKPWTILKLHPEIPVIMFSTLTQKGAAATLDALARGAVDYTGKPSNLSNNRGGADQIKNDLIPKIKIYVQEEKQAFPLPSIWKSKPC